tara:strand:- start:7182 stop:7868 length:687 start_codon:yes stop_codon:yes gene_type:complete
MKVVAFIPARGGSKRLPNKNILSFCGKPLIEYTIEYAIKSNVFDEIVVSSDSEGILEIARKYNITALQRPLEYAEDLSTTASAAKHCADYLVQNKIEFDGFVTLQVTNPFRTIDILKKGLEEFEKELPDSVISVGVNKHKLGEINEEGDFSPTMYTAGQRSQDINQLYFENGLIYITSKKVILKGEIFGDTSKVIVTDEIFSLVDIDTEEDFLLGEIIYKNYKNVLDY